MGALFAEAGFRFKQLLVAIDQALNCVVSVFIGGGWADETWSARCWREKRTQWIQFLNLFENNHCQLSFNSERERMQSPPEER
ncbi:MAG: hypothetical protein ACXV8Q_00615 [Methylobacter sp.]